jgi:hypothetical protein
MNWQVFVLNICCFSDCVDSFHPSLLWVQDRNCRMTSASPAGYCLYEIQRPRFFLLTAISTLSLKWEIWKSLTRSALERKRRLRSIQWSDCLFTGISTFTLQCFAILNEIFENRPVDGVLDLNYVTNLFSDVNFLNMSKSASQKLKISCFCKFAKASDTGHGRTEKTSQIDEQSLRCSRISISDSYTVLVYRSRQTLNCSFTTTTIINRNDRFRPIQVRWEIWNHVHSLSRAGFLQVLHNTFYRKSNRFGVYVRVVK